MPTTTREPMNIKQLIDSITPDVYQRLKQAVEIGKWPDGSALTDEQKALSMQAVIAYEEAFPDDQKTGFVPSKAAACGPKDLGQEPLKWIK